jgi:hypothetical protein
MNLCNNNVENNGKIFYNFYDVNTIRPESCWLRSRSLWLQAVSSLGFGLAAVWFWWGIAL